MNWNYDVIRSKPIRTTNQKAKTNEVWSSMHKAGVLVRCKNNSASKSASRKARASRKVQLRQTMKRCEARRYGGWQRDHYYIHQLQIKMRRANSYRNTTHLNQDRTIPDLIRHFEGRLNSYLLEVSITGIIAWGPLAQWKKQHSDYPSPMIERNTFQAPSS